MAETSAVEAQVQELLDAADDSRQAGAAWEEVGPADPSGVRWFAPGPGQQIVVEFPE